MNKVSILTLAALGLLAGALTAAAQDPQYTYGSELMNVQERLGHREIMRRLPPAQREIYRREHHNEMMERAQALGYAMPPEPPDIRAAAGRWIHAPSQAYKPPELEESAELRKELHSAGTSETAVPFPVPGMDMWPRGYPFMGYIPEPPTPPSPPSPPSPPDMYGSPFGSRGFYGGPVGGYPGWYGPGQSGYGYPGYEGPGYYGRGW
jgi:hypothetical protein